MPVSTPYEAPATRTDALATPTVTSTEIATALRSTSHWVRVFAITLGTISVLQLLLGLSLLILSVSSPPSLSSTYWQTGLALLLAAAIAVFPIMKLALFVRHAKDLGNENGYEHAADAIAEQRVFWQYVGIVFLLQIALTILKFASR